MEEFNNTEPVVVQVVGPNTCPCDDPWWDRSVFLQTIQTKYLLICDTQWLISFSQSLFNTGLLIGAFLFGLLSDKFGRLSMFAMSCLIMAVSGSLVCIMPTASTFILLRFFEGMGGGGSIVTSYVLCIEYCGRKHRETMSALFHIPINIGHVTLAGVSYVLRDCDEFQLAISIPLFLFVTSRWILMESPKWLMDKNNVEGAADVMQRFCRFNRTCSDDIKDKLEAYHRSRRTEQASKVKFWKIFKYKSLTINLFCMAAIYFICGMGYYGLSQFIGKMSGDIHLNVAISGALQLPGTMASIFLLKYFGRRPFLMVTSLLSSVFIIVVVCIPAYWSWWRVSFACLSNTFFFMSFIVVFLYGVELFPTPIRTSVLGILSVLSRLGQIVAPPVNSLSETTSGAIFGVSAMVGAALCYPLPETKNTELPSSLEDSKSLSRKNISKNDDTGVVNKSSS